MINALIFRTNVLFLFSNLMLVIRTVFHKILVKLQTGNTLIRQLLPKQSDLGLNCLSRHLRWAISVQNFKHLPFITASCLCCFHYRNFEVTLPKYSLVIFVLLIIYTANFNKLTHLECAITLLGKQITKFSIKNTNLLFLLVLCYSVFFQSQTFEQTV